MTAHNGITNDIGGKLGLVPGTVFDDAATIDISPYTCWLDAFSLFGDASDGTPHASVGAFDGILAPDYSDLWYNHLHIIPNRINLGNLTSQQVRIIEIFNGYFEPREISAITPTDLSGVNLDITLPLMLAPLESAFKNLHISTVGTPVFDGFFEITVDDAKMLYYLYVTGKRVLVMPFQHNWTDKITERLEWYNGASRSLNGVEQVLVLRDKPRRTLDYNFLLASTQTNAYRLRALFRGLLFGWQNRVYLVPIWTDATRLTSNAAAGQDVINVSTTAFDYDVGAYIMLWQDEEHYEVVEIAAVSSGSVQVTVNLLHDWPAKRTVVMPARLGYVSQNLNGNRHTPDIESVPVSFELLPQHVSVNRLIAATPVTYRSLPVLMQTNDYAPAHSFGISSDSTRTDNNTGIFTLERSSKTPDSDSTYAFLFANHLQIANYYSWLDDRKGRAGVFWQPTWAHDMVVLSDIGSSATALVIDSIGYSSLYYVDGAPAFNRRDIMIRLKNGTYYFRRITGVTLDTVTNQETVGISSALGTAVSVSSIDRVCFLVPSALKGDAVEITWESGNVSQSMIGIADVYNANI